LKRRWKMNHPPLGVAISISSGSMDRRSWTRLSFSPTIENRHPRRPVGKFQRRIHSSALERLETVDRQALGHHGRQRLCPLEWRLSFLRRKATRAARDRLLACNPRHVIMAHGEIQRENGQAFLERAFAWL
jgi:hypothetical protein